MEMCPACAKTVLPGEKNIEHKKKIYHVRCLLELGFDIEVINVMAKIEPMQATA